MDNTQNKNKNTNNRNNQPVGGGSFLLGGTPALSTATATAAQPQTSQLNSRSASFAGTPTTTSTTTMNKTAPSTMQQTRSGNTTVGSNSTSGGDGSAHSPAYEDRDGAETRATSSSSRFFTPMSSTVTMRQTTASTATLASGSSSSTMGGGGGGGGGYHSHHPSHTAGYHPSGFGGGSGSSNASCGAAAAVPPPAVPLTIVFENVTMTAPRQALSLARISATSNNNNSNNTATISDHQNTTAPSSPSSSSTAATAVPIGSDALGSGNSNSAAAKAGGDSNVYILKDISGIVRGGRLTAVVSTCGSRGDAFLLRALAGHVAPTSGSVWANGIPAMSEKFRRGSVVIDDEVQTLEELTVLQNLEFSANMRSSDIDVESAVSHVIHDLELARFLETKLVQCPPFARRRALIGKELVLDPFLICVDSAIQGITADRAKIFLKMLRDVAISGNRAVVISMVQPRWAMLQLVDDIILLEGNRMIFSGTPAELLAVSSESLAALAATGLGSFAHGVAGAAASPAPAAMNAKKASSFAAAAAAISTAGGVNNFHTNHKRVDSFRQTQSSNSNNNVSMTAKARGDSLRSEGLATIPSEKSVQRNSTDSETATNPPHSPTAPHTPQTAAGTTRRGDGRGPPRESDSADGGVGALSPGPAPGARGGTTSASAASVTRTVSLTRRGNDLYFAAASPEPIINDLYRIASNPAASLADVLDAPARLAPVERLVFEHISHYIQGEGGTFPQRSEHVSPSALVKLLQLFKASLIEIRNNRLMYFVLAVIMTCVALALAAIYKAQSGQSGMQNRIGIIFFLVSSTFLHNILNVEKLQRLYFSYLQHRRHGYFGPFTFLMHWACTNLFLRFFISAIFSLIAYSLANIQNSWDFTSLSDLVLIVAVTSFSTAVLVFFICVIVPTARVAQFILFTIYAIDVVLAGIILNINTLPQFIRVLSLGTHVRLGYEAAVLSQFQEQLFGCIPSHPFERPTTTTMPPIAPTTKALLFLQGNENNNNSMTTTSNADIHTPQPTYPDLPEACYTGDEYLKFLGFEIHRKYNNLVIMSVITGCLLVLLYFILLLVKQRGRSSRFF